MASNAITTTIIDSIIKAAKESNDTEFVFDDFFNIENLSNVINKDKLKVSEVRELIGVKNSSSSKPSKKKGKLNSYTLFGKEMRISMKTDDDWKNATFQETSKELGKRWSNLDDDSKAEWSKKAKEHNSSSESDSESESEPEKEKVSKKVIPDPEPDPEPIKEKKVKKVVKKTTKKKQVKKPVVIDEDEDEDDEDKQNNKSKKKSETFSMDDVDDMFE
jgi:hypothetical protein